MAALLPQRALTLQDLPGIGPVRAARLAEEGVRTVEDFLIMAPRRYEDRRQFLSLAQLRLLPPGHKGTVQVTVLEARCIRTRRRGFTLTRATVTDGAGEQQVVWYNQPFLARHLHAGRRLILYGTVQDARGKSTAPQLENPELELLPAGEDAEAAIHMGRIVPVYRRTAGLSPRSLRRLMHRAVGSDAMPEEEILPAGLLARQGWPGRRQALREMHFPGGETDMERLQAWSTAPQQRLIYEELFLLFLALDLRRRQRARAGRSWEVAGAAADLDGSLRRRLPFTLTPGQDAAWKTIRGDLAGGRPMARLLQGDVGSGKTAVALLAILLALDSGVQAALMAPTELLAVQHFTRLRRAVEQSGHAVHLLLGGRPDAAARDVRAALKGSSPSLVIGTHALFQREVAFARLGLVVIDEQHRFGVSQRSRLERKGRRPDLLVMTATPIPRTLALTRHGDLDLVEIRDRPPGRTPVLTEAGARAARVRAMEAVRCEAAAGRQAYIVFPLVEESEKLDVAAAGAACTALAAGPLRGLRLGLVHGRMEAAERQQAMEAFAAGEIQVLVATSVIEVGIDVPNATVLVVEHADRFGLAQLHQLRGRVGRGRHPARCFLLHGPRLTEEARQRLAVLVATDDGFEVARQDLRLRGQGELLGLRQHGATGFRLADIVRDEVLLEEARGESRLLAEKGIPRHLILAARQRWPTLVGESATGGKAGRPSVPEAASPATGSGRRGSRETPR